MATGDATDMRARLRSVLPPWFSDSNPILEGLIAGAAAILVAAYALYAYAVEQARIATATGIWLDLIAQDFFGVGLLRLINETDDAYRSRILASLFRPQATRSAISDVVEGLTGEKPTIIEPFSPADCGAYGIGYAGYGVGGAYGSMLTPAQAFIVTKRPVVPGVTNVGGYGKGPWGYGAGNGRYTSIASITSDQTIYAAIARAKAAGVRIWVAFSDYTAPQSITTEAGDVLGTEDGRVLTI